MEWRLFSPGPLFSGHKKAPSWALTGGAVPAPAGSGSFDFLLDGILEYLVLLGDVPAVIDLFERCTAVIEDVTLGRVATALIDGGALSVGFIVEIEPGLPWQEKFSSCIHQMTAIVLVRFHIGQKVVAVQVMGEVD